MKYNVCQWELGEYSLISLLFKQYYEITRSAGVRIMFVSVTLRVLEAWDEAYAGNENGDNPESSLHFEGRAVTLQLAASNTAANLGVVAQYAVCIGIDYIQHKGKYEYKYVLYVLSPFTHSLQQCLFSSYI
jgi:hypothetical protein